MPGHGEKADELRFCVRLHGAVLCGNVGIGARGQRGAATVKNGVYTLRRAAGNLHFLSLVVGQSQRITRCPLLPASASAVMDRPSSV